MLGKLQITLSLCYQILVCLIATGFSFNRSTVMYQEIDLDSFFPPQNVPAIFILNNCVLSSVTKIVLLNLGICVCLLCRLFLFHPYIYALLYSSKNCCLIVRVYMGVLTFSSFFFFHIARTPFQRRFKATPSGHIHSEEICISRNKEKSGYMHLEIISAETVEI